MTSWFFRIFKPAVSGSIDKNFVDDSECEKKFKKCLQGTYFVYDAVCVST